MGRGMVRFGRLSSGLTWRGRSCKPVGGKAKLWWVRRCFLVFCHFCQLPRLCWVAREAKEYLTRATGGGFHVSNCSGLKLHGSLGSKDRRAHLGVLSLVQLIEKACAMLWYRCSDGFARSRRLVLVLGWGREMKCYLSITPPGKQMWHGCWPKREMTCSGTTLWLVAADWRRISQTPGLENPLLFFRHWRIKARERQYQMLVEFVGANRNEMEFAERKLKGQSSCLTL